MRKIWKTKLLDKALLVHNLVKRHQVDTTVDLSTLQPRHILIFSTTALGDFLFNSPAIRSVRARYPDALITLIAHQKFADFLRTGDDWDNLAFWNNKAITIAPLLKELKQYPRPDLALLLHSHEPYDYLCAILSGAKTIIKDNYQDNVPLRDKWLADYTIAFKGHIIQRKLALVQGLGCEINDITMKLPLVLPEKQRNPQPVIGLQLGASTPERCWAPEHFASAAAHILTRHPECHFILIGGPGDTGRAAAFLQHLPQALHEKVSNRVGATGLPELCTIINNMDLLITGDTGPLHIAVTVKTPTLGLFVTANPYATGAFQDPHLHQTIYVSRRKSHSELAHVMDVIRPEQVAAKVTEMLEKGIRTLTPEEQLVE